jgi:hypothetical protein
MRRASPLKDVAPVGTVLVSTLSAPQDIDCHRWHGLARSAPLVNEDTVPYPRRKPTPITANVLFANEKSGLPQVALTRVNGFHFVQFAAERAQESQSRQLDHELGVGIE